MSYFAIKEKGDSVSNCVCIYQAKTIEDIDTDSILGSIKIWEVQEIDKVEAKKLLRKLVTKAENYEIPEKELDELLLKLRRYVSTKLSDTLFSEVTL